MIVSNSTILIFLAKIDKLFLLKELFKKILIPEEVEKEVVKEGKKRNYIDAIEVEKAINEKWIIVEKINIDPMLKDIGIDKGEAEAITLAKKKNLPILLDQTHARHAAKLLELKPRGTIYVLLRALKKGFISYDNYELALLDLIDIGFRMSQEVYIEAIRLGRKIKKL